MNKTTAYSYNSYGQLSSITDPTGVMTEFEYDSIHFLTRITRDGKTVDRFVRDPLNRVTGHTDSTGLALSWSYTDLDQVSRVTWPDGTHADYAYTGCCPFLLDSVTDRSGRTTAYAYDARKNRIAVTNPDGTKIRMEYDKNLNPVKLTDAGGRATAFDYDDRNRLISKTFADGRKNTWSYDSAGRVSQKINSRGQTTGYQYDPYQNLYQVIDTNGKTLIRNTYDDYDRLTSRTDALGTTAYGYDGDSRLLTVDGPWADDTLTYQYDALGRMTGVTPQGGTPLAYSYDTLGRLATVTTGAGAFAYTYKTDVSPLVRTLTRPGTGTTEYDYDNLNRLASIVNKNASGTQITKNSFTYNAQGLIDTETGTFNDAIAGFTNGRITYSYNTVNQLLSATNPDQAFSYDPDGNMTKGYTPEGYAYTAEYDAFNTLSSIEYKDDSNISHRTEFVYGGDGFAGLIRQYDNGVKTSETRLVRSGSLVLQERDQNNEVIREYVWGLNMGGGIGGLLNMAFQGGNHHYLYDGKGNVTALIDSAQNIVASYRYDPFGKLMAKSGTLDQPFRFSTKRYFAGLGMNDYGYRLYAPVVGRWLNRDPIGEDGGINLYQFVLNDPVNLIDPEGLFAPVIAAVAAALGSEAAANAAFATMAVAAAAWGTWNSSHSDDSSDDDSSRSWSGSNDGHSGSVCNQASEHTKNKRKSSWDKHTGRRSDDPEKGDANRRTPSKDPRPKDQRKGPWPPKPKK